MRKYKSDSSSVWLGVIFVIVFIIAIFSFGQHETKMKDWAKQNNYEFVSAEHCYFTHGPYWFHDKNDFVYKAIVRDKLEKEHIVWFKFGLYMQAELEK